MPREGMLRASRYEELQDAFIEEYRRKKEMLTDELFADGYPPFTAPVDEAEAYLRLVLMRQSGDPQAYTPQAERAYADFQRKYGPPPFVR